MEEPLECLNLDTLSKSSLIAIIKEQRDMNKSLSKSHLEYRENLAVAKSCLKVSEHVFKVSIN